MAFKRILLRRDTAANWTSGNAVLASGEVGYETNTGKFKIGNGTTAWNSLGYSIASNISAAVLDDLGDVTITSTANGDLLKWNGSAWVNAGGYALLASPTFTGTVSGITKAMVGLGNADNTSDANKPISTATQAALDLNSTATQAALDLKSNLASPTFTGTVTTSNLTVGGNLTVSGTTTSVNTETLTVDDNIIVLNNNATGTPSENAGIEVERGSSTNVTLRWNESTDKWQITSDGSAYGDIATEAYAESLTPATLDAIGDVTIVSAASGDFLKWSGSAWVNDPINLATDTVGNYMVGVSGGTGISVTHTPGEGSTATVAVDTAVIAPLASPTFTGTPAAPTAVSGTNTTQIATTAFVKVATASDNDQFVLAGQVF